MANGIITDAKVRKLRPKASRDDKASGVPNLKVRIEPTDRKSWISLFGSGPTRKTVKIGDTRAVPARAGDVQPGRRSAGSGE
jgi:hypothetical protein